MKWIAYGKWILQQEFNANKFPQSIDFLTQFFLRIR